MATRNPPVSGGRGRGRPIGSDSAETRAAILRAAREVINERGYEAATFQAIAVRAGFSRPTMHYYFQTKEEIYETLQQEAYAIVADCIATARREDGLYRQLSAFTGAARRSDVPDGSLMRFIVASRFEQHRCPSLRGTVTPASEAVAEFYAWAVGEAIATGELDADADAPAVVNMLYAMFWGMGFFAGFVHSADDLAAIAKQLNLMFRKGLLNSSSTSDSGAVESPARGPALAMVSDPGRDGNARHLGAVAFGA